MFDDKHMTEQKKPRQGQRRGFASVRMQTAALLLRIQGITLSSNTP